MGVFTLGSPSLRARLAVPVSSLLVMSLIQGCGQQAPAFDSSSQNVPTKEVASGDATNAASGAGGAGAHGGVGGDSSSVGEGGAGGAGAQGGAGGDSSSAGMKGAGSGGAGGAGAGAGGAAGGGTDSSSGIGGSGAGAGGAGAGGAGSAGGAGGAGAGGAGAGGAGGAGAGGAGGAGAGGAGGNAGGGEGNVNLTKHTVDTIQKGGGKIDLLWVIDNSASMAPEQDNVAANFNTFIHQLSDAHLDFQTAITTTDVCQQTMPADLTQRACPVSGYGGSAASHLRGTFIGDAGHQVLKSTDSDLVSRFNTYVRQGANGSDFEHGLTAVQLAVQKSLSGENQALIRPDAFLAVIVLSDEEDDGIGLGMTDGYNGHNFVADGITKYRYTSDDMMTYLKGTKGLGKFSVSGIVGTRNSNGTMCSSPVASPREEGTQYIAAAKKSGGIIRSVCDTDWGNSMTQIGLDIAAQATQITLPTKPDVATIQVTINGVPSADWTYNTANDAVKFNTGKVPADGAAIRIVYFDAQN